MASKTEPSFAYVKGEVEEVLHDSEDVETITTALIMPQLTLEEVL